LKFQGEVWAGRACAAANEKELTTCAKRGGQEEKKIQKKWEQPDRSRRQPAAGGRPAVKGLLSLLGRVEKNFSSHFKRYKLTIREVNFCKTFSKCSCSSLGQDLTVKSEKKWKKNQ
jgi:hypothetical protein